MPYFVREFTATGVIVSSTVAADEASAVTTALGLLSGIVPAFAAGVAEDREGAPVAIYLRDADGGVARFAYGCAHSDGSWTPAGDG